MNIASHGFAREAVNVDELRARCMGDTEMMRRVLLKFQDRFRTDLSELERGLEDGDMVTVTRAAHRLKGASGNVSAPDLMGLASEIEQLGRTEETEEIPSRIKQLHVAWERFVDTVSTLEIS